jgi:hypothetical protein
VKRRDSAQVTYIAAGNMALIGLGGRSGSIRNLREPRLVQVLVNALEQMKLGLLISDIRVDSWITVESGPIHE